MTDEPDFAVRGPLLLLIAQMACWKCKASTKVGAWAARNPAEAFLDYAQPPRWVVFDDGYALSEVVQVSASLGARARDMLPTFRPDHSRTAELTYWMNHCSSCGASIGDHYLHSHPDGPYFTWERAGREGIEVIELGYGEVDCSTPNITPPELMPRRRKRTSP